MGVEENGPQLSHHTANLIGSNLLLVGGWNGKSRTSDLLAYNLKEGKWLKTQHMKEKSNPPFGLSGHTCTKINQKLFCVLGREGGLKIQRKFGDIFLLHVRMKEDTCSYW